MDVENCNEIIREVERSCVFQESCIDVSILNSTPILKQFYYTSSSTFVVFGGGKCAETVELEHTTFALLIEVEDGEATVSLENGDGEFLGEIREVE